MSESGPQGAGGVPLGATAAGAGSGDRAGSREACPLCGAVGAEFHRDRRRTYLRCTECALVFVPPEHRPDPVTERSVYELHENSPHDQGYRAFLSRTANAIAQRVPAGSCGLDFGCGPGPTLSVMLEEMGYEMAIYDPFFAPDQAALERTYDFVTATEVVEHLHHPASTLATMWSCVGSGGILAIMTQMVIDREAFARWRYKEDETHVCFYSRETFDVVGERVGSTPEFVGRDVVLFGRR